MSIEAPPLERKLVAILAADVEGYSRMMHADEEATLATLSSHRAIIDGLIAAASGDITSTAGDSVLAEFASVIAAVNCAVDIQKALAEANAALAPERRMDLRIGINVGDVMVKDGGIFGDGVNVAARVEALAPPGGICITRGVRDHIRDRLNFMFEDLGDHSVKNIPRAVHVYRVVFDQREIDARTSMTGEAEPVAQDQAPVDESEEIELTFWRSVETGNTPEEYQAYLDRYPQGKFAALAAARQESAAVKAPETIQDHEVELVFWDSVKDSDDPLMFQAYLTKYPSGKFTPIAELRVQALSH